MITPKAYQASRALVVRRVEWDTNQVSALIVLGNQEHQLRFAASEDIGKEVDFLLPAAMLLAMRTRACLKLPGDQLVDALSDLFLRLPGIGKLLQHTNVPPTDRSS